MAYAQASQLQALKDAAGDDATLILARNNLLDALSARWTADGTLTGTDITDPEFPIEGAYSGRLDEGTKPTGASAADVYYVAELPAAGVPLDSICIKLLALDASATFEVRVQISNGSGFDDGAGNPDAGPIGADLVQTVAKWTVTGGSNPKRLIAWALGPPAGASPGPITDYLDPEDAKAQLYTKVPFIRVRVTHTSGTISTQPHIGEFWISTRRQLARGFLTDGQFSERPDGADVNDFQAKSRATTRYVRAKGYRDIRGTYPMGETDIYSLPTNDVDTMHGVIDDSEEGTNPIWVCVRPKTSPQRTQFGFLEDVSDLRLALQDFRLREFSLSLIEMPPFQKEEPA